MKWSWLAGLGIGATISLIYAQGRRQGTAERASRHSAPARIARTGAAEPDATSHPHSILSIINEWPHQHLIEIHGIGPVLATKIISHRPYRTAQEFVDSKLLPPKAIEALQKAA
jgi:DNA uptake protein ComE-like DNA-binding protein